MVCFMKHNSFFFLASFFSMLILASEQEPIKGIMYLYPIAPVYACSLEKEYSNIFGTPLSASDVLIEVNVANDNSSTPWGGNQQPFLNNRVFPKYFPVKFLEKKATEGSTLSFTIYETPFLLACNQESRSNTRFEDALGICLKSKIFHLHVDDKKIDNAPRIKSGSWFSLPKKFTAHWPFNMSILGFGMLIGYFVRAVHFNMLLSHALKHIKR